MAEDHVARVEALYRYPVKGLSPQVLDAVELVAGQPMPFDRAWAVQDERGRFDPSAPKYLPKINFLMLMRDEALAALETQFDEASLALTILRDGKEVAHGDLSTGAGRREIENFLSAYMSPSIRGQANIVHAKGHSFSDVSAKCVHIVNRASITELERITESEINATRFRPNVVVDGWPAWFERSLVGRELSIGVVRLKVFDRTVRCAATNVDPASGERDMAIPDLLLKTFGRADFGVYAKVLTDGRILHGDGVNA